VRHSRAHAVTDGPRSAGDAECAAGLWASEVIVMAGHCGAVDAPPALDRPVVAAKWPPLSHGHRDGSPADSTISAILCPALSRRPRHLLCRHPPTARRPRPRERMSAARPARPLSPPSPVKKLAGAPYECSGRGPRPARSVSEADGEHQAGQSRRPRRAAAGGPGTECVAGGRGRLGGHRAGRAVRGRPRAVRPGGPRAGAIASGAYAPDPRRIARAMLDALTGGRG